MMIPPFGRSVAVWSSSLLLSISLLLSSLFIWSTTTILVVSSLPSSFWIVSGWAFTTTTSSYSVLVPCCTTTRTVSPRPFRTLLFRTSTTTTTIITTASSSSSSSDDGSTATTTSSSSSSSSSSNILSDAPTKKLRGNVNEIDYCIAPADVSLSRAYTSSGSSSSSSTTSNEDGTGGGDGGFLSLTRALNNASNRAVRRIILVSSWPSPEEFNLSLRRTVVLQQQQLTPDSAGAALATREETTAETTDEAKCPVPRPILNVLTRKKTTDPILEGTTTTASSAPSSNLSSPPPSRTDAEYIRDQMDSFRARYGTLPGFPYAQEYLQCLLSLATSGVEDAEAVALVRQHEVYHGAYQRLLAVLQTVGVEFEPVNDDDDEYPGGRRRRIAKRWNDQDICLSVWDQLQMRGGENEMMMTTTMTLPNALALPAVADTVVEEPVDTFNDRTDITTTSSSNNNNSSSNSKAKTRWWGKWFSKKTKDDLRSASSSSSSSSTTTTTTTMEEDNSNTLETATIHRSSNNNNNNNDATTTGILLSKPEPTLTRQLNVWSNIVLRVLLFGGDQELLVVAETLQSDLPILIQRWYPTINGSQSVSPPGIDYIQCLIQLLRNCYSNGVVTDLDPPIPLSSSFANSYERLVATAVELGSGYLKPVPFILQQQQQQGAPDTATSGSSSSSSSTPGATTPNAMETNIGLVASIPKPRTAQEELGRFALLESNFRQAQQLSSPSSPALYTPYPQDLVGQWEVRDEISGEFIGDSVVTFLDNGNVQVPPPLEGLRWRLDPGPTHLDTCTFQVLSTIDRTILQYRGFIDRGARLEARFSKRPIRIRGSVMFQMREGGSVDYYKDMLPINYRTGTTKFVMTKITK